VPDTDPYRLPEDAVREPPRTLWGALEHLGPGIILSAGIVGSGELIATTVLGAKAGFVTLWIILASCVVKVALQLEFGKHAIASAEPTMVAFNRLPGPRIANINWTIWTWLFLMIFKFLQAGGIVGGVALTLNIVFPAIGVGAWAAVTAVTVALLVFRGHYRFIEKLSLVLLGLFVVFTLASVVSVQFTPYRFSLSDIADGLQLSLPAATVGFALAAFGITGVGGDEIMLYGYWCLEKGYARRAGERQQTPEWTARAKGWIKVMYLDAWVSMAIYTVVTAAFYVLGASVLHGQATVPQGYDMIRALSTMYTETLGPWAEGVFLLGAFVVLFSTLFAGLAGSTRIWTDTLARIGVLDFYDEVARRRSIAVLSWVFPAIWCALFLLVKLPVLMVMVGGLATSIILLLVVFAAFNFRYRMLPGELRPSRFYDTALWLSAAAIVFLGVYGIVKLF
jgi:Mn2+/Fe2+ NRAMP family transporter